MLDEQSVAKAIVVQKGGQGGAEKTYIFIFLAEDLGLQVSGLLVINDYHDKHEDAYVKDHLYFVHQATIRQRQQQYKHPQIYSMKKAQSFLSTNYNEKAISMPFSSKEISGNKGEVSKKALQQQNNEEIGKQLEYINKTINPIISKMMIRIINQNPADLIDFMIDYIKKEEEEASKNEFSATLNKTISPNKRIDRSQQEMLKSSKIIYKSSTKIAEY